MTADDIKEPSYYEIALTNRQVLVAFVLILGCVLAAFLSGVWIGRKGVEDARIAAGNGSEVSGVPVLRFPSDEPGGGGLNKPPVREKLLTDPSPDTTLAQDLGREPQDQEDKKGRGKGHRGRGSRANNKTEESSPPAKTPPPAKTAPPAETAPLAKTAPPPPKSPPPPPMGAKPAPEDSAGPQDGFVVQVFSTHDAGKARQIVDNLKKGSFQAYLSTIEKDGTMYRVRIGPFPSREDAEQVKERVNRQYQQYGKAWVTEASN